MEHTEIGPYPWPAKGDSIFRENDDWRLNADLKWEPGASFRYSVGYRQAAQIVFDDLVRPPGDEPPVGEVDFLIFPLAFLWRHYLELKLKEVLQICERLKVHRTIKALDDKAIQAALKSHGLRQLWRLLNPLLKPHIDRKEYEAFAQVGSIVLEWDSLDRGSFNFRYARKKAKDGGTTSIRGSLTFLNARSVHECMMGVANFLDTADDLLLRMLQHEREMASELGGA